MLHRSHRPATGARRNDVVGKWQAILPVVASMIDSRHALQSSAPARSAPRRLQDECRSGARTLRTFIVDDSMLIQGTLTTALEDLAPVTVVGHAADESAAADWLAAHGGDCDLIVLDIWLRFGTGLGLLEREVFRAFRGRCVVFTNHASPELEKNCRMLGADAVFGKADGFHQLLSYCAELAKDGARYSISPFFNA